MDRCEMKRFLDALPWPDMTRPVLTYHWHASHGHMVALTEPLSRECACSARVAGPTPEGSLRHALEAWVIEKGLNDRPEFFDALRRLLN